MRSAVFGRYWSTGGGAEKYGGVMAQLLARCGPVDLLTHDDVDLSWLAERLQLDLSGVSVRTIDDRAGAVTEAGADYDLFVNVSFMSADEAPHGRSVYVVHFPTSPGAQMAAWKKGILRLTRGLRRSLPQVRRSGFYHREFGRRGLTWTSGQGRLFITSQPGRRVPVVIRFGDQRPPGVQDAQVDLVVDGQPLSRETIVPSRGLVGRRLGVPLRFEVRPEADSTVEVQIRSDTFCPAEVGVGDDARTLGLPVRSIRVGKGVLGRLAAHYPILSMAAPALDWADGYGVLVANSEFTRGWLQRYWDRDAQVLYPPVTMFERGSKEPLILNAGRFFGAHQGHSKKQLEMVQAFRRLCESGLTGWRLQLVGGCSPEGEEYLQAVRQAATGYPVEITVNASGSELASLYSTASIYWHASGLGENADRRPDRLEHFGITTVEAMSAGAVPVVIGLAGQLETVRHGVDGYHFRSVRELMSLTRRLIEAPDELERMSASAEERARAFSIQAFDDGLQAILKELGV